MDEYNTKKDNFTWIGLLIILAASAVLMYLIFFVASPKDITLKTRDIDRIADMKSLSMAVELYLADGANFDSLESDKIYRSNDGSVTADGTGWLPLNFQMVSSGAPIDFLPRDPVETASYRFTVNKENKTYELDCLLEDKSNQTLARNDHGNNPDIYELGNDLGLIQ